MLRVFPMSLTGAASRWLRNKPPGSIKTWEDLKTKFLSKYCPPTQTTKKMEEINNFQQDPDETLYQAWTRSTETSDGLVAIQAQLNNLEREIKKVNEKVYDAQVGCEQCKGPHYTKDCPLEEEGKTLEEAYYTQFGAPFQQGGQYRAAALGFYQRNNANPLYQEQRQSIEESLAYFISESAKRHEENSNLIKEIRASTDAAIRNQGASIKTLEIQIGQISKNSKLMFESRRTTILFPIHLNDYDYDENNGSYGLQCLDAYSYGATRVDDSLPRKEKDPGSELAHSKLTVELADRIVKYPNGIAENILVGIGKFVFPVDFIIQDMPEDVKVPLILGRPFLSTAHAKIDVFKRKITLRVGDEKTIFKSMKLASSMIKRVYMLSLRERMELDLEARLMGETLVLNRSLDPLYGDYIKINDLNVPLELRRDQVDDLMPTMRKVR
ncbi:DNA-directed DNA polymerase [Tanacetum coccineum]